MKQAKRGHAARETGGSETAEREAAASGRVVVPVPVSWTMTPAGARSLRARANGFTPERQRKFIKTLRKTGCVRDGCRVARISSQTAYRTRQRLPEFRKAWDTALRIAGSDIELLAWERAVDGVAVTTMRGGEIVSVTKKPSDAIFRMILMASNKKKYSRMNPGGETRTQIEARVRRETTDALIRDRKWTPPMSADALRAVIMAKWAEKREEYKAKGWTEPVAGGEMIPPAGDGAND